MESEEKSVKSWLSQLKSHLSVEPESIDALLNILKTATQNKILETQTLSMIEGILAISNMQVRDAMIPRSQMIVIDKNQSVESILKIVSEASHSRFPVINEDKDDIVGIVLVKDVLKAYVAKNEIRLDAIMRQPYFVPESKRLDVLLNEFRAHHNHLAVVVDEYGGIAGLISIEDVLEQIVGEIEDEFDPIDSEALVKINPDHYHLSALTPLEEVNAQIGTDFHDDEVDTIGGLLTRRLGRIPQPGESATVQDWNICVLRVDSRRILQVEIKRQTA